MKDTYTVKYRQPGQWLWRRVKGVRGDGVEGMFRYFHTDDDAILYVSAQAEVLFPPQRQQVITKQMSKHAGTPVVRD